MFGPGIWRMKRFADSVPEIIDLQREINRLFPMSDKARHWITPPLMYGKRRQPDCDDRGAGH